jgi:hypothetical protein
MIRSSPAGAAAASNPAIRAADLQADLATLDLSVAAAEAYDTAENLIGAYGYYLDESPGDLASLFARSFREESGARSLTSGGTAFVNQILQPVIDAAPDGKNARIQARLLELGGTSGGVGYWTAGSFEAQIVSEQDTWKFQMARSSPVWSAPYPGGWARTR